MGGVRWLPDRAVVEPDTWASDANHPSRVLLERALAEGADGEAWSRLIELYETQAATWQAWVDENPHYLDALGAALEHTGHAARALEVGCGTGAATALLAGHAESVLATDASPAMIARAPAIAGVTWAVADVRAIPAPDGAFDLVAGVNAIPWIPELVRVTAAGGWLVWVASFGADTPLYLSPERFATLLGDGWDGLAGRVGRGTWCAMRRLP